MTGPTVVQPLLRDLRLRPRLKTILEAEGVLIDPIGALLAGFILQLVIRPGVRTLAAQTGGIAVSIGFGLLAGLAAGFLLAGALRYRLIARGYENVLTLASVVLLFEGCDTLLAPSGLVAVTIAGIVIGNLDTRVGRDLREFPEDPYAILTVRRGQRPAPFRLDHDPRQGDIATVAIHRPARQAAVARLGRLGWHPQAESVASVPAAL